MSDLPVVVIGAGPQGLAAAAHLLERGLDPLVLEAGDGPAAAVNEWGHVRLFSDWSELVDTTAGRLLEGTGWTAPAKGYPTGAQWISRYLSPLAEALGDRVRYGTTVTGIGRQGRDRLVDAGRSEQPFTVHVNAGGTEERITARAVIDASGTWSTPNPLGADGLPALGEKAAAAFISDRIPDFHDHDRFAGKHTVVVGSGHSAATAINELTRVAKQHPDTRITWVLRRGGVGNTFGGGTADELPERGALGARAQKSVEAGIVDLVTGFRVERINTTDTGAVLISEDGRALPEADLVVALTGFRPDLSFLSEVRLELDATLQAPIRIAAEVDPNVHSCGSVRATGAADLAQPEQDFYLVGAKSYGRAPTFLAMTGYEQIRSVVAELAGDHEAAARIDLILPDTGVCGGAGLFDDPTGARGGACCAPASTLLQIGRAPVTA
ncbi:NAD(P)-binding domain-containing protein [Frondihabitans sucicola]|uniref:NAD(P)-binding domain-containing protein n=1 Tax=Frondihabitans sucicola TaxID=1268041 RepID=UPI0025723D83|nr:NAD(P)-binding domain-containing protein [Frondihabitans sucicola]